MYECMITAVTVSRIRRSSSCSHISVVCRHQSQTPADLLCPSPSQTQRGSELISHVKSDRRRFLISAVTHSSSATWTCPSTRRWAGGTPAVPGGASAPSPGRSPSGRWARRWPRPGSPAAWPPAPAATGPAGPPAGCSLEENTMKRKHEQEFKGWKSLKTFFSFLLMQQRNWSQLLNVQQNRKDCYDSSVP